MFVCWFPDRQVFPLYTGGPDKSKRMSAVSMGGENPHMLINLLFFNIHDADKRFGGELTWVL